MLLFYTIKLIFFIVINFKLIRISFTIFKMGIVYVAESYDSIKIGESGDETERQNSLKYEFSVPTGYFIKLAFRCKKSGKSKEVEDKFLAKFKKYKVERYKGSTRDDESRESFDRKK